MRGFTPSLSPPPLILFHCFLFLPSSLLLFVFSSPYRFLEALTCAAQAPTDKAADVTRILAIVRPIPTVVSRNSTKKWLVLMVCKPY